MASYQKCRSAGQPLSVDRVAACVPGNGISSTGCSWRTGRHRGTLAGISWLFSDHRAPFELVDPDRAWLARWRYDHHAVGLAEPQSDSL
jgi:hypothetical protein